MTPLEKLILARAVIEHPDHWTQGVYARTEDGRGVLEDDEHAVCWCLKGACRLASADLGLFHFELSPIYHGGVPEFNDGPATCHSDVLSLLDRVIAKLL